MAVLVRLPETLRTDLKSPAGPIYTDTERLLEASGDPLITVGDVVTDHVLQAGVTPHVALVDNRTERSAVDDAVSERIASATFDHEVAVENPAGALTEELLDELIRAIDGDGTTRITVEGEEDLAALPAVVLAPPGGTVVYGQPGSGMVLVPVEDETRKQMRDLLMQMEGDIDRLAKLLEGA